MSNTWGRESKAIMSNITVITDSNAGIAQKEAEALGIRVVPMPFRIGDADYFEDINLTQEEFYRLLADGKDVTTSMPAPGTLIDLFDEVLETSDEIIYIPMSSGLSGSMESARMIAQDYDGRVEVVDNQRISVTQRQSVLDALALIKEDGDRDARTIRRILEMDALNASIYIMLDTLYYLKKGGRITPAAAAVGTLLHIKPVLQIQGEKLDAFAKARTVANGKRIMLNAIREDAEKRFKGLDPDNLLIAAAYTKDTESAEIWKREIEEAFPGFDVFMAPLSLSISCHIGPGALAVTVTKKLNPRLSEYARRENIKMEIREEKAALKERLKAEKEAYKAQVKVRKEEFRDAKRARKETLKELKRKKK